MQFYFVVDRLCAFF